MGGKGNDGRGVSNGCGDDDDGCDRKYCNGIKWVKEMGYGSSFVIKYCKKQRDLVIGPGQWAYAKFWYGLIYVILIIFVKCNVSECVFSLHQIPRNLGIFFSSHAVVSVSRI